MGFEKEKHSSAIDAKCNALSIPLGEDWLYVSVKRQRLYHYQGGELLKAYAVSTSMRPMSTVEDSLGTPKGLHRIAKRIGADAPQGTVFKGRQSMGRRYWEIPPEERGGNYVTTRILWLEGMEDGLNKGQGKDSFNRYIYIHGTNHESRIGTRQSNGCVLLTNEDIIELYDRMYEGVLVLIESR